MPDVIGLSDVSSKDTGRGSQLKTGNLKRSYNMPKACVQKKMKQGMSAKAAHKACYPKKKASKKKPTKQMSEKESKIWSDYIRKGSFYQPDSSQEAILDSLIQAKLKKIK